MKRYSMLPWLFDYIIFLQWIRSNLTSVIDLYRTDICSPVLWTSVGWRTKGKGPPAVTNADSKWHVLRRSVTPPAWAQSLTRLEPSDTSNTAYSFHMWMQKLQMQRAEPLANRELAHSRAFTSNANQHCCMW